MYIYVCVCIVQPVQEIAQITIKGEETGSTKLHIENKEK